jgi:UDPglucose--hexose-1-phosphate uridylyltransferase
MVRSKIWILDSSFLQLHELLPSYKSNWAPACSIGFFYLCILFLSAKMPEEILNDISHRRYNPLRGSWLLVSPHRTKRPWQYNLHSTASSSANSLAEANRNLPLRSHSPNMIPQYAPLSTKTTPLTKPVLPLPRQQASTRRHEPEIRNHIRLRKRLQRRQRIASRIHARRGSLWSVSRLPSRFPSPHLNPPPDLSNLLLRAAPVTGKCYVLTFSSSHNLTLADLSPAQILPVINVWTSIYASHLSPSSPLSRIPLNLPAPTQMIEKPSAQYTWMQIFENKGAAMGCSNPHPHGQIWTTTGLPEEPAAELRQLIKYRKERGGRNLLEDYAKLEMEKKERIVFENEGFLVVCPWWAVWPFEVMVVSKRHRRSLVDLSEQERKDFAEAIAEVTRRYDNLFETSFPYSEFPLSLSPLVQWLSFGYRC